MRINKWIPIVLAINIGVLCFALYVATTYQQQNYIVSSPCFAFSTNVVIFEAMSKLFRTIYLDIDTPTA